MNVQLFIYEYPYAEYRKYKAGGGGRGRDQENKIDVMRKKTRKEDVEGE